jgi:37-kD nucleoid-associated bacterial protein
VSYSFSNLRMKRLITHEVFERKTDGDIATPKCSNKLTQLNDTGMETLRTRIVDAVGNNSYSLELDIKNTNEGSTFEVATRILDSDDEAFIKHSKEVARLLADAQKSRRIPGGVLVVFDGTVGAKNNRFIGLIKAETHEGFSKKDNENELSIEFISNLLLTPSQKLFKIGFFIEISHDSLGQDKRAYEDFQAFVYDRNMTRTDSQQAAIYFYDGFLGCKVSDTSKVLTKTFYKTAKDFIQEKVVVEKQVDTMTALVTYLRVDQSATISPSDFADRYLDQNTRDDFLNHLTSEHFPSASVAKDLTLIDRTLRDRKLRFSSDVKLEAPSENFNESIELIEQGDNYTLVKIKGHITGEK